MPVLRVRAYVDVPVALTEPLHLDALMVACSDGVSGQHITRSCPAEDIIRPRIPACSLTYGGHAVVLCSAEVLPPEARRRSEHLTRRRDGEDIDYLDRPVDTRSGPGRDVMLRFPVVETPYVEWWCVGRRKAVRRLIARRIQSIGATRRHGYGVVRRWEIETTDEPVSSVLVAGGVARRNLPAEWCDSEEIVESVPVAAPYWHPANVVPGLRAGRRTGLTDGVLRALEGVC